MGRRRTKLAISVAAKTHLPGMGIKTKEQWQGYVCSACGSVVGDFACHPLDLAKVRLQLSKSGVLGEVYRGSMHCASATIRNEGLRGLFKGLSPALLRHRMGWVA